MEIEVCGTHGNWILFILKTWRIRKLLLIKETVLILLSKDLNSICLMSHLIGLNLDFHNVANKILNPYQKKGISYCGGNL